MRKIKIERKTGYYGKIRELKLLVDSNYVGSVKQGKFVEIEIPDGARELRGKMDWGKTHPFSLVALKDGDLVTFSPYFTLNPLRNLGIMNIPILIKLQ